MRGTLHDWEALYVRVRNGDAEALVRLRAAAIKRVTFLRRTTFALPPWQREEFAEEAFDRTEPSFPKIETFSRAFAYMLKTADRLIVRAIARGRRISLDNLVAESILDPQPARRILEAEIADFILETGCGLPTRQYRQFRALVRSCWVRPEGRDALASDAGISPRTWASDRKKLLEHLRKLLSDKV